MKVRLVIVIGVSAFVFAAGAVWWESGAIAAQPALLSGPPADIYVMGLACAVTTGQAQVPAGQPFAVRLGGWLSGTPGLVESYFPKDASTVTIERPVGTTPMPSTFQWQVPTPMEGLWGSLRWTPVFTLALGEQMAIQLTAIQTEPARDLAPPPSTVDPTEFGFPPYDGIGLKYDGGVLPPYTYSYPSCTITGV